MNFLSSIKKAFEFCTNHDALLSLGITPTHPNTGYGYIQFNQSDANNDGIFKVNAFKEKPSLSKAVEFLAAGNYLWNSGIFVWSVKRLLQSFKKNAPEILNILEQGNKFYNTTDEQNFINEYYPTTPNISIDYAVLERAKNVVGIPAGEIGWNDVGIWNAVYELH